MNNERRKRIEDARAKLEEVLHDLESLRDEERDSFDNRTEALQQTEDGQKSEAAADALDEAVSGVEGAITELDTAAE